MFLEPIALCLEVHVGNPKPDDLVARFRRLPQAEQQMALAYVEQFDLSAHGSALLSHVNTIPADDLKEIAQAIDAFARDAAVFVCDRGSAERYGRLKARLRSRGTPIPENDL